MKTNISNRYTRVAAAWVVILGFAPALTWGQKQTLSLEQAVEQARSRNRELRIDSMNIHKSTQQTAITRGLLMPNIGVTGSVQHYFQRPVFLRPGWKFVGFFRKDRLRKVWRRGRRDCSDFTCAADLQSGPQTGNRQSKVA